MRLHSYLPVRAPGGDRGRDWRDRAACVDYDPELFHPMPEADPTPALTVCAGCPVTRECLDWAMAIGDDHAVLGGTTPAQRRQMRQQAVAVAGSRNVCVQCRLGFTSRRAGQRFCSPTCHHASMAKVSGAECGTTAAARRHRKRGEQLDDACRMAESLYRAQLRTGVRRRPSHDKQGANA